MKLKTKIVAIALGLVASTSLVWSADRPSRETTPTIQGVWQETRCRANYYRHGIYSRLRVWLSRSSDNHRKARGD